jgi:hypothetical protein
VFLKSAGPRMTVQGFMADHENLIKCKWLVDENLVEDHCYDIALSLEYSDPININISYIW